MKRVSSLQRLAGWLALVCASAAGADAPIIECEGFTCGGAGSPVHTYPFAYVYVVDAASYPMMEFRVAVNDLDAAHYTNVVIPDGWQFAVEEFPVQQSCGTFTAHGSMSLLPCFSVSPGSIRWWTDDPAQVVEQFVFAYDHPNPPMDVGWILTTQREETPGQPLVEHIFMAQFDTPVGTGTGPVHAPREAFACWSNDDCTPTHYCWFEHCAAETGACLQRPIACPDVWDPVCGCDGQTYANDCDAAAAGMSIDHFGACGCRADFDFDFAVGTSDFFYMLQSWGPCAAPPSLCRTDIDGPDGGPDGMVDTWDFFFLLQHWGPCAE
jgi:hypothetical protein